MIIVYTTFAIMSRKIFKPFEGLLYDKVYNHTCLPIKALYGAIRALRIDFRNMGNPMHETNLTTSTIWPFAMAYIIFID